MPTSEYKTIEDALSKFLELAGDQGQVITSGALACAGPVVDNACDMTNLEWVVDGNSIRERFGMRTAVMFQLLTAFVIMRSAACTWHCEAKSPCVELQLATVANGQSPTGETM